MIRPFLQVVGVIACAMPLAAQADEYSFGTDVSARLGYSTNPYSVSGTNTDSASAQLEVRPAFRLTRERSVLMLSGMASVEQYFDHYSRLDNYEARADYRLRPSERLNTHLNLAYTSSVIGSYQSAFQAGGNGAEGEDPSIVPGTDIGLFGTRSRRQSLNLGGDLSLSLSERDRLSGSAFFLDSSYSGISGIGDYKAYGATLAYARKLSSYSEVGVQLTDAQYDYAIAGNNSHILSPQVTIATQFDSRWTASGAVGASFIDREGQGETVTYSGNLSLCRKDARGTLCLTGRRSVLPTGTSGTQIETGGGATYRYRLSEYGALGLAADYRTNRNSQAGGTTANEYVRGSVSYDHQLQQRVRLTATAFYRDIFGGAFARKADAGGQLGVAMRFGDLR